MSATRPLPQQTELAEGYWEAARRHELAVQRCTDCGVLRHYPQERCPECLSAAVEWATLSGRGTIYTYVVAHAAFHPFFQDRLPYVVATIDLDEGIRMVSDLDEPEDAIRIGAPVEVFFEELAGEITLPRFRLSKPKP
ncbi:MAG: OB-fold domain-containing protein [Deltaproteobacteria bacterium]|jgi:uncharacterized OB-fold protein|nr:OB-fold domain-containing protein [Deltaproteobacteria bacterium]